MSYRPRQRTPEQAHQLGQKTRVWNVSQGSGWRVATLPVSMTSEIRKKNVPNNLGMTMQTEKATAVEMEMHGYCILPGIGVQIDCF